MQHATCVVCNEIRMEFFRESIGTCANGSGFVCLLLGEHKEMRMKDYGGIDKAASR